MKRIRIRAPVGPPRFGPEEFLGLSLMFPLTLPGTGGSRVQRHELFPKGFFPIGKIPKLKRYGIYAEAFHHGMDAAALNAVNGTAGAGNAKGVFYDN